MQHIIIIQKNGDVIEKKVKDINEDNLYLKCGFKSNVDFSHRHSFYCNNYYIHIYAKCKGKSNMINKFELPPPIDNILYYGNILVIKSNKKKEIDIEKYTLEEWNKDYEKLMGGFEDLESINENSDDETNEDKYYNKKKITKQGYLKDGFVVDDKSNMNDEENEDNETILIEDDNSNDETEVNSDEDTISINNSESNIANDDTDIDYEESDDDYMGELEEEDYISED